MVLSTARVHRGESATARCASKKIIRLHPSPLSHLRQFRKIMREGLHAAGGLAPVEVFVRRMVAMLRQAEPHKQDRHLPGFLHRDHGADRSTFADEGRFFPEPSLHRPLHRFDIGPVEQCP